jgi:hypothetical protein
LYNAQLQYATNARHRSFMTSRPTGLRNWNKLAHFFE